ncbi:MAG: class I SAM-dependent methyltransferase [Actinomycetota bacterium]
MAWAWVRPADRRVLEGRPLLDLGTGDAQTLSALVEPRGLVVGVDRSSEALAAGKGRGFRLVGAEAHAVPFAAGTFDTVLAGDLFHHVDDERLSEVLAEVRRILRDGGRLVAWWYEVSGRQSPDAPRYPRLFEEVARAARGLRVDRLELEMTLEPAPPTVGLVAQR